MGSIPSQDAPVRQQRAWKTSLMIFTCSGSVANFAAKPSRRAAKRLGAQALGITKVGRSRIDRRDARGGRREKREVARETPGPGIGAGLVPASLGADVRPQSLGVPGEADQPRAHLPGPRQADQRRGRVGDCDDAGRTVLEAAERLADGEPGGELLDPGLERLGQHDREGRLPDDGVEIGIGLGVAKRTHPDHQRGGKALRSSRGDAPRSPAPPPSRRAQRRDRSRPRRRRSRAPPEASPRRRPAR